MSWDKERLNLIIKYLESMVFNSADVGLLQFESVSTHDDIELKPMVLHGQSFVKEVLVTTEIAKILKKRNVKYIRNVRDNVNSRMIFISRSSLLEHKWEDDKGFRSFTVIKKYNL